MPSLRINAQDQRRMALDDLQATADGVDGITIAPASSDTVTVTVGKRSWRPHLHVADSVSADDAAALTLTSPRGTHLLVANIIGQRAREVLEAAGWSWLDRRIGLHLTYGSVLAVVRFHPESPLIGHGRALTSTAGRRTSSPAADGPITGRAGISYAAAVLCEPEHAPSIRRVATQVGMSPSAIGDAAKRLRDDGLIDSTNRPTVPDLFDALAAVWRPERLTTVATLPDPAHDRLELNLDALDDPGWALGGDLAALAWGAPLFTTDSPPWLWVPSQTEARRAERALGTTSWDDRAAVVAVAPTPIVCRTRFRPASAETEWPTTHPIFIALDLATDGGRGREILDGWDPEGFVRVW